MKDLGCVGGAVLSAVAAGHEHRPVFQRHAHMIGARLQHRRATPQERRAVNVIRRLLVSSLTDARLLVEETVVDAVVEKLDEKLREWEAATANEVRRRIVEIIELADEDALDLLRSRIAEQEVLDLLDEPPTK